MGSGGDEVGELRCDGIGGEVSPDFYNEIMPILRNHFRMKSR
jgi:hypothetical protein